MDLIWTGCKWTIENDLLQKIGFHTGSPKSYVTEHGVKSSVMKVDGL